MSILVAIRFDESQNPDPAWSFNFRTLSEPSET